MVRVEPMSWFRAAFAKTRHKPRESCVNRLAKHSYVLLTKPLTLKIIISERQVVGCKIYFRLTIMVVVCGEVAPQLQHPAAPM